MEQPSHAAVEKVLGEPFGMQPGEDLLKTRRNLLAVGAASVFIWFAELKISSDAGAVTLVGVSLKGLSHHEFGAAMALALLYLIFHYVWGSLDLVSEFRMRVTGTRLAYSTGSKWGSESADYPDDPRQSTLYSWWVAKNRGFGDLLATVAGLKEAIDQRLAQMDGIVRAGQAGSADVERLVLETRSNANAQTQIDALQQILIAVDKTVRDSRPPVSLARFDRAFRAHAVQQNLRWLVMDFLVPLAIGVAGWGAATQMAAQVP